jgi:hypothetical protein
VFVLFFQGNNKRTSTPFAFSIKGLSPCHKDNEEWGEKPLSEAACGSHAAVLAPSLMSAFLSSG